MTEAGDQIYSLLYLDDDPSAIHHLRLLIQNQSAQIRADYFGSPNQAILAHQDRNYDIVISDLRLGTTTGVEVIAQMKQFAPSTAYILISGDADLSAALAAVNELKALRFLVKPCTQHDLESALADADQYLQELRKQQALNLTRGAIDRMELAVASFDEKFRLTHANAAAQALLNENPIVELSPSDQLTSTGMMTTNELYIALRASFDAPERQGLPISGNAESDPASLVLYPLQDGKNRASAPSYSFLIIDTAKSREVDTVTLSQALNISMSEARVVRDLACGLSLEDTARSCNLSLSTVRTYLKNVYAKTGVSRQAELVGLALRTAI